MTPMTTTRAGGDGYRVRERSSFSCTASRMNSERFPLPASVSIRSSISGARRMAVNFTPREGRPIRAALSVTQLFSSGGILGLT